MKKNETITRIISAAGITALGLAVGAALLAPMAEAVPEPQPEPALLDVAEVAAPDHEVEHVVVTEPVFVIVARKPGAPMATGDLAVEAVEFDAPTRIRVYRTPAEAMATAEPHDAVLGR